MENKNRNPEAKETSQQPKQKILRKPRPRNHGGTLAGAPSRTIAADDQSLLDKLPEETNEPKKIPKVNLFGTHLSVPDPETARVIQENSREKTQNTLSEQSSEPILLTEEATYHTGDTSQHPGLFDKIDLQTPILQHSQEIQSIRDYFGSLTIPYLLEQILSGNLNHQGQIPHALLALVLIHGMLNPSEEFYQKANIQQKEYTWMFYDKTRLIAQTRTKEATYRLMVEVFQNFKNPPKDPTQASYFSF